MVFKQNQLDNIAVSVIIVNYNTYKYTRQCLKSIFEKTKTIKFEIILVDNNSDECNPDQLIKGFPEIKLIKNNENVGFGIANNQGMEIAKGKYILLLNSDTYLMNNAIEKAFEFAESYLDNTKVFGANLRNADFTFQKSFFIKNAPSLKNTLYYSFITQNPLLSGYFSGKEDLSKEIGGLYGAYIFLHRSVFESVGGFDPDFFMYCEDTEWFRKRVNRIFKIKLCHNATVIHLGGCSSKDMIVKPLNMLSYYLYWYKLGYKHYLIYLSGSFLNVLLTMPLLPFMSKNERKRHACIIYYRLKLTPRLLFDIPRFRNGLGARRQSLKL